VYLLHTTSRSLSRYRGENVDHPRRWLRHCGFRTGSFARLTCCNRTQIRVSILLMPGMIYVTVEQNSAPNSYFCRFHLLSLHSGRHHPSAPNPAILDLGMELTGRPHFTIIVSGPYLGVMYHCERAWAGLVVWKWTTGQIQLVTASPISTVCI
jgi:hypothetical protein